MKLRVPQSAFRIPERHSNIIHTIADALLASVRTGRVNRACTTWSILRNGLSARCMSTRLGCWVVRWVLQRFRANRPRGRGAARRALGKRSGAGQLARSQANNDAPCRPPARISLNDALKARLYVNRARQEIAELKSAAPENPAVLQSASQTRAIAGLRRPRTSSKTAHSAEKTPVHALAPRPKLVLLCPRLTMARVGEPRNCRARSWAMNRSQR